MQQKDSLATSVECPGLLDYLCLMGNTGWSATARVCVLCVTIVVLSQMMCLKKKKKKANKQYNSKAFLSGRITQNI